jgi:aminopeptidase N
MKAPTKFYLKDYTPTGFELAKVDLKFDIFEDHTLVTNKMQVRNLHKASNLFLDGEDLILESLTLNDQEPSFLIQEKGLLIKNIPPEFTLQISTKIFPNKNTRLEGLYQSGATLVTQNEPQGFRRITYFLDRPDVMTVFDTVITADQKKYPVLLSNGDLIEKKKLADGRHWVHWRDPFKKPCYLFALVAGDYGCLRSDFTTQSGKSINLEIYCSKGMEPRCHHAMESLKKAMRWDEVRFQREYDLSTYMIVAADDFNAGAMENKGLNIFNSKLVLADPVTASDADFEAIESVVAHEYFHNWTGNRITLRDWFNLSLKEGLTVFRDQEFSMDQSSRSLVRIESVKALRAGQFPEDAGPNAHPVQPRSCFAVDNFFTSTIYEKGAEVIRMMQTIVGRPGFRKGMDLYFERFDGQAVTIQDFAECIAQANQQDFSQFSFWYSQAGTPSVTVKETYDASKKTHLITFTQNCALTEQEKSEGFTKQLFHIPLMIEATCDDKILDLSSDKNIQKNTENNFIFHLKEKTQTLELTKVSSKPITSINRQFSAPIYLKHEPSLFDRNHLIKNDSDPFVRWELTQEIYLREMQLLYKACKKAQILEVESNLFDLMASFLKDPSLDLHMKALLLELPDDSFFVQNLESLESENLNKMRTSIENEIAKHLQEILLSTYLSLHISNDSEVSPQAFGRRKLKNQCLHYLSKLPQFQELALKQLHESRMMNDQQAALSFLVDGSFYREQAIEFFYNRWRHESLVLNKWFAILASSSHESTFLTVQKLLEHPEFQMKNPNRVYSLLARFGDNLSVFHTKNSGTYEFFCTALKKVDELNPNVASRLAQVFDVFPKLDPLLKKELSKCLRNLLASGLSSNVYEIISSHKPEETPS